jgi:hypothetical protein
MRIIEILNCRFYNAKHKFRATVLNYSKSRCHSLETVSDIFLLGSVIFRDEDAAIFEFGARYGNFIGRLSYDINTSSLNSVSSGRGDTEFSLTYIFSRPNPNPVPTCPRL